MDHERRLSDALDTPADVAGLVAYQEGAVVSRTLLKLDAGSLTVFAFDAGQGISEHTAPHEAVVHVLEGTAEVSVGGEIARVGAGEAIRFPAGVPHALAAPERFKMLLVMLRAGSVDS